MFSDLSLSIYHHQPVAYRAPEAVQHSGMILRFFRPSKYRFNFSAAVINICLRDAV